MDQVEVRVVIPRDRIAEFYGLIARWLAGEAVSPTMRRGVRRGRRAKGPSASSYAPLGVHLSDRKEESVTLGFDEIETILGRSLPGSASKHRAWWANTDTHSQAMVWLAAGFVVDDVDLDARTITFRRAG